MRSSLLIGLVLSVCALGMACGGDSKSSDGGSASGAEAPTPGGPPLDDATYLKVLCTGLTNYLEAANTKPREGIEKAVKDYIASLEKVNPPEDVKPFHREYLRYLKDALDDPTNLLTRKPPKPEDGVRKRLDEETKKVPECRFPTFLNQGG